MKDIIITKECQKKELYIFGVCFIIAFIINVLAVVIYKTSWIEIISQIGYVIVISIVLYLAVSFFRLVLFGIKKLFRKVR